MAVKKVDIRKKFFSLNSPEKVADLLEVKYKWLIYYIYRLPEKERYEVFSINKKSGEPRIVMAPSTPLKIVQRKLCDILNEVYKPKPSVHGFVQNRNVVTNASLHSRKRYVLNLDIENFFPSINFGRVRGMFLKKPYEMPEKVATILAQICCHKNQLPQGAPTSPVVSNMICARLDGELQRLAKANNCTYTRYADDITFSTSRPSFPENIAKIKLGSSVHDVILGKDLLRIIGENGFATNEKKTRLQRRNHKQEVTGLTVNRYPNITRKYTNQIRAMLYSWEKYGLEKAQEKFIEKYDQKYRSHFKGNPCFKKVLRGKINYMKMVRGAYNPLFIKYAKKLSAIDEDYKVIYKEKIETLLNRENPIFSIWLVENHGMNAQGTAFMLEGVGLVTCHHVLRFDSYVSKPDVNQDKYKLKLMKDNDEVDLSVIEIEENNINRNYQLKRGNLDLTKHGDTIKLLGFPSYSPGKSVQVYEGRVTGYRNYLGEKCIVIDALILDGNSGGPILNSNNEVIAVAVAGYSSLKERQLDDNIGLNIELVDKI